MADQVRQTRQQTLQANGQQPFRQPTAQPVRNEEVPLGHTIFLTLHFV
jgi:hypothetical protein